MALANVPEPVPGPEQVLVEVRHASLNHGDLIDARSGRVPPGGVLGSDVAGVVELPAMGGLITAAPGGELATLLDLVAAGDLAVEIGWRGPLERASDAAELLLARKLRGKAIFDLRPASAS
jgi:NADPH:quinone reductase-like Zn-dependent oxidoreductase